MSKASSYYPEGVTGNEPEITGEWEDEEETPSPWEPDTLEEFYDYYGD